MDNVDNDDLPFNFDGFRDFDLDLFDVFVVDEY